MFQSQKFDNTDKDGNQRELGKTEGGGGGSFLFKPATYTTVITNIAHEIRPFNLSKVGKNPASDDGRFPHLVITPTYEVTIPDGDTVKLDRANMTVCAIHDGILYKPTVAAPVPDGSAATENPVWYPAVKFLEELGAFSGATGSWTIDGNFVSYTGRVLRVQFNIEAYVRKQGNDRAINFNAKRFKEFLAERNVVLDFDGDWKEQLYAVAAVYKEETGRYLSFKMSPTYFSNLTVEEAEAIGCFVASDGTIYVDEHAPEAEAAKIKEAASASSGNKRGGRTRR